MTTKKEQGTQPAFLAVHNFQDTELEEGRKYLPLLPPSGATLPTDQELEWSLMAESICPEWSCFP